ncbi:MAG: hypothetical protein QF755_05345 [Candidatus Peribacteraceae bacterium]|nr:hypothetical protein [Candidatus Peribacteraceae bacterium]HCI03761.1 hypothetical protein [Candidatus Peribacteria bacterium]|tara:strand:+ start:1403 stop:2164 length:762 start_codon:yes stop_codon:yes gene_type:complete
MSHRNQVGGAHGASRRMRHRSTESERTKPEQPAQPNCSPATAFLGVKMLEGERAKLADVCGEIAFKLDGVRIRVSNDIAGTLGKERFPKNVAIPPMCDTALQIEVTPTFQESGKTPGTMIAEANRLLWLALKPNDLKIAAPLAHLSVGELTESYIYHTRARTENLTQIPPDKFLGVLGSLLYQHERPDREDDFNFDAGTIFRDGSGFAINLANDSTSKKFSLGAHHAMYKVNQADPSIPFLRFQDEEHENNWE